jgi:1-phosphofructokinase
MIVTLTPNPSLDRTVEIDELRRGEVHRATGGRVDPGGKGVNVSRALAACDTATIAVLPSGGPEGAQLAALLAPFGVQTVQVPIGGTVRSNITIAEPDGTTTKLNEAGPELTADEAAAVARTVVDLASRANWVVGAGSLPRGLGVDFYARLVTALRDSQTQVCIDASGPPLAAAVDAGPDLIKPNAEELAELVGRPLARLADVVDAAAEIRKRGVGTVLVSLGGDGALLVSADEVLHGWAPSVRVRSTVGAGDSTLAGFLAGGGRGRPALVTAIAYGTAAVQLPGSVMPRPSDLNPDAVVVTDTPDLDRALTWARVRQSSKSQDDIEYGRNRRMSEVITADLVDLDLKAADRQSASRQLAERLVAAGRVTDIEGFLADIAKRESQMPTGLEGGIGIPHCRSAHVAEPSLAFGRASEGVDFGAPDGPADIIFLIAAPEGGDASHMKILASLARRLIRAQFKERLRSVQDPAEAAEFIRSEVS